MAAYKIFTAAHVLISLAIGSLIHCTVARRTALLKAFALASILAAPPLLLVWLANATGPNVCLTLDAWRYIPEALVQLRLQDTWLGGQVSAMAVAGRLTAGGFAALAVAVPAYLLGSLGLRVVGLPMMLRDLISPSSTTPVRLLLAVFCVVGPALTLTLTVAPEDIPAQQAYNNAVWFFVQSKYAAWIFALRTDW